MAGDELTGCRSCASTAGLDNGPVCAKRTEPIEPEDTYGTLAARLEALGGELLVQTLDERPPCAEQDEALATYADKIVPEDRELDPARTAVELERVVRALTPHIGAYVTLGDGTSLGVSEARALAGRRAAGGSGLVRRAVPVLGCVEGSLELVTVQPPGRRAMSGEDYLRGRRQLAAVPAGAAPRVRRRARARSW